VIFNHKYEKSKFLRGVFFTEKDINIEDEVISSVEYINKKREFIYVDKFLSFTPVQNSIIDFTPPLLIIGSAGSGKTSVTIEKLKSLKGKILYTSLSTYLVENTKELCYENRNIDFLTFSEVLNRVEKQKNTEVDFEAFKAWAYRHNIKEVEKYFEEVNGILTGTHEYDYYPKDIYLTLGVKQSLFSKEQREEVYSYFQKYLDWIEEEAIYDSNIVAFDLLLKVKAKYDFIIVDEIQDFTNIQIYFIFKMLKDEKNFIFAGDSNQILYANFFSWTKLKAMLLKESQDSKVIILKENYRNSKQITMLSNQLLEIKQLRFGSIDKESNYLSNTSSNVEGSIHYIIESAKVIKEFNEETSESVDFAIIVFNKKMKKEIKSKFNTPLVFTIQEAKGLEYKNVILLNFVSQNSDAFTNIVSNVSKKDLNSKLNYTRQKDKEKREIEAYKIYINSLYVAFTRGVENLYIIEKKNHRLFELLDLIEEKKKQIVVKKSSQSDWEKEAEKLKKLKKSEQLENIVQKKLYIPKEKKKTTKVKKVIQVKKKVIKVKATLKELEKIVFHSENVSKSDKNQLFKLAKQENNLKVIEQLYIQHKFKTAEKYLENYHKPKVEKKSNFINPFESREVLDMSDVNLSAFISQSGSFSYVKKAIEKNANINKTDEEGYTPLMSAVKVNKKSIVKLLLEQGADKNYRCNGKKAIEIAKDRGYKEIALLLKTF
jgi:hypothetical protein